MLFIVTVEPFRTAAYLWKDIASIGARREELAGKWSLYFAERGNDSLIVPKQ